MSDINENMFSEWFRIKQEIKELQKKDLKYKTIVDNYLQDKNKKSMTTNNFKVTKKTQMTCRINKNSIPDDLWQRYSISTPYTTFSLVPLDTSLKNII